MARTKGATKLPTGIRKYGEGFQTFGKVNGKQIPRKSWPADTPIDTMQTWLKDQRQAFAGDASTGFAADIETYCQRKAALTSIELRRGHLEFIARKIGADRSRFTITATELDTVFANLEKNGAAVSTVHNYRASIRAFFNVMDPDRVNPVRKTTVRAIPAGGAKGRRFETIRAILANLSNRGNARHRINVMAYTGIPPALLKKVTAADLLPSPLAPTEIRIAPRRKGAGVAARMLPLTSEGARAFVAFHNANAYGSFATTGLNAAFQRAASMASVEGISLYALRHSFLTHMYRVTRDLAAVARFAMHAPGSPLTAQYAAAANEDVDAAAVAAFNASMAAIEARQAAAEAAPAASAALPEAA